MAQGMVTSQRLGLGLESKTQQGRWHFREHTNDSASLHMCLVSARSDLPARSSTGSRCCTSKHCALVQCNTNGDTSLSPECDGGLTVYAVDGIQQEVDRYTRHFCSHRSASEHVCGFLEYSVACLKAVCDATYTRIALEHISLEVVVGAQAVLREDDDQALALG